MTRKINNLWGSVRIGSICVITPVAEVMISVPALMEVESLEGDLTDVHIALETDSLHGSSWETMIEVSQLKGNY